jgi:tetratricopeptide (TPR) repeat protein
VRVHRTVARLFQSAVTGAVASGLVWIAAGGIFPVLTQAEHRSAADWRALGTADLRRSRFDGAISAFQHSLELQPDSARVFYGLGVAYAGKHDPAHAFEWLERARASHRFDMTEITEEANLAALRADPRFANLLPSAADFEHPFVEAVKKSGVEVVSWKHVRGK